MWFHFNCCMKLLLLPTPCHRVLIIFFHFDVLIEIKGLFSISLLRVEGRSKSFMQQLKCNHIKGYWCKKKPSIKWKRKMLFYFLIRPLHAVLFYFIHFQVSLEYNKSVVISCVYGIDWLCLSDFGYDKESKRVGFEAFWKKNLYKFNEILLFQFVVKITSVLWHFGLLLSLSLSRTNFKWWGFVCNLRLGFLSFLFFGKQPAVVELKMTKDLC